ncbi:hypothetical protein Taro_044998 [Colocasia esculenta]|uniref:Uncharacterized protein n=1 Tax=Colocasia esculenta TaxID=4460 RepID=A0A843X3K1_COLES|nr:hypothetical protein [Colocasia esculenta]
MPMRLGEQETLTGGAKRGNRIRSQMDPTAEPVPSLPPRLSRSPVWDAAEGFASLLWPLVACRTSKKLLPPLIHLSLAFSFRPLLTGLYLLLLSLCVFLCV